MTQIKL